MKKILLALFLFFASTSAQAALVTKEIPYQDGDVKLTGYLAYDDSIKTPMPGILVIHEWWGYNDYVKMRAQMLAKLGYVAFAVNMYGTGVIANNPDEAKKLSEPFYNDRKMMRTRALAGMAVLTSQPMVDKSNLGVIGYCFGGTVALELARGGTEAKGIVSFHGGLSTPLLAQKGDIKAPVLALNGADDKFVSDKEKQTFRKEMTDAGVNFKSIEYPGATHAFTNPQATEIGQKFNMPIAYNKEADEKSWAEMRSFFAEVFKK